MNPLAPGPQPGIPIFEWHTQTVSCGTSFTDAEAEEAARRHREEREQEELRERRERETMRRVAHIEGERDAELAKLPPIAKPSPVDKNEIRGQGCAIGCGLWVVLIGVSLAVLGLNGQLDSESDPTILGVENPLLFLPATWLVGWLIASIRLGKVRRRHRAAEAEAERRAGERARVQAAFGEKITAARRAAQP